MRIQVDHKSCWVDDCVGVGQLVSSKTSLIHSFRLDIGTQNFVDLICVHLPFPCARVILSSILRQSALDKLLS
jgi:hypothetical protein